LKELASDLPLEAGGYSIQNKYEEHSNNYFTLNTKLKATQNTKLQSAISSRTYPLPSPTGTISSAILTSPVIDPRTFISFDAHTKLKFGYPSPELDLALKRKAMNIIWPTNVTDAELEGSEKYSRDIIISVFNAANILHAKNLECSLQRVGIASGWLGIVLDESAVSLCKNLSLDCVLASAPFRLNSTERHYHGDSNFKYLSKLKSRNVLEVLLRGYNVLLLDTDIIMLRDPLLFLRLGSLRWDFQVQSDSPYKGPKAAYMNSGMYYVKATTNSINFFYTVWQAGLAMPRHSEQNTFNKMLGIFQEEQQRIFNETAVDDYNTIAQNNNNDNNTFFKFRYLTTENFCNGANYFVSDNPNSFAIRADAPPNPYLIHFNWLYGYLKEATMKRHGFWNLSRRGKCKTPIRHNS
jgi:hypothetical protein